MNKRDHGKQRKHHHQARIDFWPAWREQWHLPDDDQGRQDHGPPSQPGMKGSRWRQFFHDFMGIWPEHHWAVGGRRFSPWVQGDVEFNPFLASVLSKGGGLLPILILNLLTSNPLYGNEIMDLITQRTGGQWLANPGAVYPLLTVLEGHGLVQSQWEDPYKRTKRIYNLTDSGKYELERLKSIMRPRLKEAIGSLSALLSDLSEEAEEADLHDGEV
jgi:DNA-binding PadR family transcriptional regulator